MLLQYLLIIVLTHPIWHVRIPGHMLIYGNPVWVQRMAIIKGKVKRIIKDNKKVVDNKVVEDSTSMDVEVEITEVFEGNKSLVGKVFLDQFRIKTYSGREASVPFELDDEGLWVVEKELHEDVVHVCSFGGQENSSFKARLCHFEPDYKTHLEIAIVNSKFETLPNEKVVPILAAMAVEKDKIKSDWALKRLSRLGYSLAEEALDDITKKSISDLSIENQVTLDLINLRREPCRWTDSKARNKLFTTWITSRYSESEKTSIIYHIRYSVKKSLTVEAANSYLRVVADNDESSFEIRCLAIEMLGMISKECYSEPDTIDWIIKKTYSDCHDTVRLSCVGALQNFKLRDQDKSTLKTRMKNEKSDIIICEVSKFLKK
jgi:hypothetical protein